MGDEALWKCVCGHKCTSGHGCRTLKPKTRTELYTELYTDLAAAQKDCEALEAELLLRMNHGITLREERIRCRSMEADLAAEKKRVADLTLELGEMREKCEGLEEDGKRLDWLEGNYDYTFKHDSDLESEWYWISPNKRKYGGEYINLRITIDAARSEQSKAPIPHGTCEEGVTDDRT